MRGRKRVPRMSLACHTCGETVIRPACQLPASGRVFCSLSCVAKASRPTRQTREPSTCGQCGGAFRQQRTANMRRFCSDTCRRKYNRDAQFERNPLAFFRENIRRIMGGWTRRCRFCGVTFTGKANALYCSGPCRSNASYYRTGQPKLFGALVVKECPECGANFLPPFGRGQSRSVKYCGPQCRRRVGHRRRTRCPMSRALHRQRRDAQKRLYGGKVNAVNAKVVFQRDGGRCQICGATLSWGLRGSYKAAAPEVDHIIPLSGGGEHSYRNVQLACRRCNLLKGAQMMERTA